jgi:hypothetical protein
MLLIASLLYFSQNFLYKTNPRISSRQNANDDKDSFILNNTNIAFAFNIEGLDPEEILSNKWFTTEIYFTFRDQTNSEELTHKNLSLMNCTEIKNIFNKLENGRMGDKFYKNSLCFNLTLTETETLLLANQGMEINLKLKCGLQNDYGINCLYEEYFVKKFKRKKITFYYIDVSLDFDNNTDPFVKKLHSEFVYLNPLLGGYLEYIYNNVAVDSDFGILFSSSYIQKELKLHRIMRNYMINKYSEKHNMNDIIIAGLKISFAEHEEYFKRVYYKLQHVFAEVGGILNGILLIGRLTVFLFSKTFFYENLINDYFYNYIEKEDEHGINKNDFSRRVITENYNKRIKKKYIEENKSQMNPNDYIPKASKKIRSKSKIRKYCIEDNYENYKKENLENYPKEEIKANSIIKNFNIKKTNEIKKTKKIRKELELSSNLAIVKKSEKKHQIELINNEAYLYTFNNININNNSSNLDIDLTNRSGMLLNQNDIVNNSETIKNENCNFTRFKDLNNNNKVNQKIKNENSSARILNDNLYKENDIFKNNDLKEPNDSNLILGKNYFEDIEFKSINIKIDLNEKTNNLNLNINNDNKIDDRKISEN